MAFMVMLNGCEKFTEGFNNDPTQLTDASEVNIFSGAQLAYMQFDEGELARLAAIFTQQATGASQQYASYQNYSLASEDFSNAWATAYVDCFANIKIVEGKATSKANLRGAAEVLEGLHMGTMTALWGDIPYSQANQVLANKNIQPTFDDQLTVYSNVQTVLTKGIADLATLDGSLSSDIFSSGNDISLWKKLAYSAKARYYMHVARYYSYSLAYMDSVINNGLKGMIATTGADDISFTHGTAQGGNQNLWYSFLQNDRAGYMDASVTFAQPMLYYRNVDGKSVDTARMQYYYSKSAKYLDLNYVDGACAISNSFPIIRASETLTLIAEAYYRKGDLPSALTYLNFARTYANNVYGSSLTEYASMDAAVTGTKLLQSILNEEYLALMLQMEGFNFARRVNFAITYTDSSSLAVVHTITPITGTVFPQRYLYSMDEIDANPHTPSTTLNQVTTVNSK
jgi:hypothetical protein